MSKSNWDKGFTSGAKAGRNSDSPDTAYTQGFLAGMTWQEDRIVKILKQQGIIADVDDVIAQIKGEK